MICSNNSWNSRHLHQALKQYSQEKLTKYTVTVLVFSAVHSYLICCLYDSISNLWVETIILIYFSCCSLQDAKGPYNLNLRHKSKFKHVIFFHEEHLGTHSTDLFLNQTPSDLKHSNSRPSNQRESWGTWCALSF